MQNYNFSVAISAIDLIFQKYEKYVKKNKTNNEKRYVHNYI